ncbi:MAG: response regulator transcription factor [Puniceicoccales bacterium]|jgi:two-component system phosphate regulon response regulator PhoB|nr:response regulator transcription factor [Puniceicoccales bacterium]
MALTTLLHAGSKLTVKIGKQPGAKILVADDEPDVNEILEYTFRRAGFAVRTTTDPLQVISLARDFRPDAIILDVMMPELSGFHLLRMLRTDSLLKDTPVIFLTARVENSDRIRGFELGADDYVPKPFDVRELLLRTQALLKRAAAPTPANQGNVLNAGEIILNVERHTVDVKGTSISLTATEFNLLRLLIERKGRVQTRERLLGDVWGYSSDIETRTVDTHIRRLREKLGRAADIVETIRGVGYKIEG